MQRLYLGKLFLCFTFKLHLFSVLFATPLFRCVYLICFPSYYLTSFWCCTAVPVKKFIKFNLDLPTNLPTSHVGWTRSSSKLHIVFTDVWSLSHSTWEFICMVSQMLTSLSSSVSLRNNCCCLLIKGWQSFRCVVKRALLHLQQRPSSRGGGVQAVY